MIEDQARKALEAICYDVALKKRREESYDIAAVVGLHTVASNNGAQSSRTSIRKENTKMQLSRKPTHSLVAPGILAAVIFELGPVWDGKCRLTFTVFHLTWKVDRGGKRCGGSQAVACGGKETNTTGDKWEHAHWKVPPPHRVTASRSRREVSEALCVCCCVAKRLTQNVACMGNKTKNCN